LGLDCLIVGRGGGSIEDLWAFNEEMVAQAIFDCRTPVISAVGHETDVTIADFVADMRASTPSAAAELAVFEYDRFREELSGIKERMHRQLLNQLESKRELLRQSERQLKLLHPRNRLMEYMRQTGEWEELLKRVFVDKMKDSRHRLLVYSTRLEGLSPLARLSGGYVYASTESGSPLTSVAQIIPSDCLKLRLKDGEVTARAEEVVKDKAAGSEGCTDIAGER
jgi:exodeoxyribonuclease VII large subunit